MFSKKTCLFKYYKFEHVISALKKRINSINNFGA